MPNPTISCAEQLECAERELKLRQRVYPRRVADGKMTQAQADRELARMEAIIATLRGLAELERLL